MNLHILASYRNYPLVDDMPKKEFIAAPGFVRCPILPKPRVRLFKSIYFKNGFRLGLI